MEKLILNPIGMIRSDEGNMYIALDGRYAPALKGLDAFSHVQVLWWFSGCDNEKDRAMLVQHAPYKGGPDKLGTFATRSPLRPNPIALTCAQITYIDLEAAIVGIGYTEAFDGTPVLDIKPYTPSLDRVEAPGVPDWASRWPMSLEASDEFDWGSVMDE